MRMSGEQAIAAPRAAVWAALNDPDVLRQCLPGCETLVAEDAEHFAATIAVKIGPIGARFKGAAALSEIVPGVSYRLSGEGQGGIAGSAKGGAAVRLADAPGGGTLLSYEVDAEVGGRMAQLGGPIIDATAKQLAGQFFAKLDAVVAGGAGAAAPVAAASAHPPAQASGWPWAWLLALAVAVIAGVALGRAALPDLWVLAVVGAVLAAAATGFAAGRRR